MKSLHNSHPLALCCAGTCPISVQQTQSMRPWACVTVAFFPGWLALLSSRGGKTNTQTHTQTHTHNTYIGVCDKDWIYSTIPRNGNRANGNHLEICLSKKPDLSLSGLDPVPPSKIGTRLLASLGSKGKNRNSLACL